MLTPACFSVFSKILHPSSGLKCVFSCVAAKTSWLTFVLGKLVGTCKHHCKPGMIIKCSPTGWDFCCQFFTRYWQRKDLVGNPGATRVVLWISELCGCMKLFVFRVTDPELGEFIWYLHCVPSLAGLFSRAVSSLPLLSLHCWSWACSCLYLLLSLFFFFSVVALLRL